MGSQGTNYKGQASYITISPHDGNQYLFFLKQREYGDLHAGYPLSTFSTPPRMPVPYLLRDEFGTGLAAAKISLGRGV